MPRSGVASFKNLQSEKVVNLEKVIIRDIRDDGLRYVVVGDGSSISGTRDSLFQEYRSFDDSKILSGVRDLGLLKKGTKVMLTNRNNSEQPFYSLVEEVDISLTINNAGSLENLSLYKLASGGRGISIVKNRIPGEYIQITEDNTFNSLDSLLNELNRNYVETQIAFKKIPIDLKNNQLLKINSLGYDYYGKLILSERVEEGKKILIKGQIIGVQPITDKQWSVFILDSKGVIHEVDLSSMKDIYLSENSYRLHLPQTINTTLNIVSYDELFLIKNDDDRLSQSFLIEKTKAKQEIWGEELLKILQDDGHFQELSTHQLEDLLNLEGKVVVGTGTTDNIFNYDSVVKFSGLVVKAEKVMSTSDKIRFIRLSLATSEGVRIVKLNSLGKLWMRSSKMDTEYREFIINVLQGGG